MDQPPTPPPASYQYNHPTPKKGLSTGAKLGIGCGGLILLAIIGGVIAMMMVAPKLSAYADEMTNNPTRAAAKMLVTGSLGKIKMVAEDDVKKRYTLKTESSGSLLTMYWDEQTKEAKTVIGDFSAIPVPGADGAPEIEAVPETITEEP